MCLYPDRQNPVENPIRTSAIGKKSWLYIGQPAANQRSAMIYSLVVTCQRHREHQFAYLNDTLAHLQTLTNRDDPTPLSAATWQPS